ncbi:dihydrodipicolinate reductase [Paracoccaceae bacterium GXU_MW_L88]
MKHVYLLIALAMAGTAAAQQAVQDRTSFFSLVEGKTLTRFGVSLNVLADGRITGSAFGGDVGGSWSWDGPYFCRELIFSGDSLGYDCQTVTLSDNRLTFQAEQGQGDTATLAIE